MWHCHSIRVRDRERLSSIFITLRTVYTCSSKDTFTFVLTVRFTEADATAYRFVCHATWQWPAKQINLVIITKKMETEIERGKSFWCTNRGNPIARFRSSGLQSVIPWSLSSKTVANSFQSLESWTGLHQYLQTANIWSQNVRHTGDF